MIKPMEKKMVASSTIKTLDDVRKMASKIRVRLRSAVRGRDDVIDLVLIVLFGDGHVLLEDYPGSGKTTLAKALGDSIIDDLPKDEIPEFRRIQFTPDLLPSDVTGVTVFDTQTSTFFFRRGPVFAHVVLADEINRTSPKVQSALLEAMAEKQVTVDNVTYPLDDLFLVMATQNPLDLAGTYPLPLPQLDRFLFKIRMHYVTREAEIDVLTSWREREKGVPEDLPRVTRTDIVTSRDIIKEQVKISPKIYECLVDIARNLRKDKRVVQGVSTRSLVLALPALQTLAMLSSRDFVSSADIEAIMVPLFHHRLELLPGVDETDTVIRQAAAPALEDLAQWTMMR